MSRVIETNASIQIGLTEAVFGVLLLLLFYFLFSRCCCLNSNRFNFNAHRTNTFALRVFASKIVSRLARAEWHKFRMNVILEKRVTLPFLFGLCDCGLDDGFLVVWLFKNSPWQMLFNPLLVY